MKASEQKLKEYAAAREKLIANPRAFVAIPCPIEYCDAKFYVYSTSDLDEVEAGNLVCDYCSAHDFKPKTIAEWESITPPLFRTPPTASDTERFPKDAWSAICNWAKNAPETHRSIYVFGDTGTCKSRMMYEALKYIALSKLTFTAVNGGGIRSAFYATYDAKDKYAATNRAKAAWVNAGVLFFDDFGQDALTETMLADVWQILDTRFCSLRPTAFASNFAPRDLAERYGKLFSMDSLIRRIEEFADIIKV